MAKEKIFTDKKHRFNKTIQIKGVYVNFDGNGEAEVEDTQVESITSGSGFFTEAKFKEHMKNVIENKPVVETKATTSKEPKVQVITEIPAGKQLEITGDFTMKLLDTPKEEDPQLTDLKKELNKNTVPQLHEIAKASNLSEAEWKDANKPALVHYLAQKMLEELNAEPAAPVTEAPTTEEPNGPAEEGATEE